EVVVARVRVAALAIGQLVADRVVIIALDTGDVRFVQPWEDAIGVWTEGAEVAEAVADLHAAPAGVLERRLQRQVVAVQAAEDGDPCSFRYRVVRWTHSHTAPRTGSR